MKQLLLRASLVVFWIALAVWLSALIAPGVAAMSAFTTLPDPELGLSLEKFADFEPGAAAHGRIAAGHVLEPIFTFSDLVQLMAGALALIALLIQLILLRGRWTALSHLLRLGCVVLAVGLFAYRATMMTPGMNRDLRAYWDAAAAGEIETAQKHRAAFDRIHQRAETMYSITLVLILIAIGASAVALSPSASRTEDNA